MSEDTTPTPPTDETPQAGSVYLGSELYFTLWNDIFERIDTLLCGAEDAAEHATHVMLADEMVTIVRKYGPQVVELAASQERAQEAIRQLMERAPGPFRDLLRPQGEGEADGQPG